MDQVSVQLPQPPKPKTKGIFFVEIGLFEIGFVIVLLIVAFGALNYFHVITLPQLSTLLPTIFTKKNPSLSDKQLQSNLTSFVLTTLKGPYQPVSYTFQKTMSGNIITILSNWQQQNSNFTAKVTYDQSTNTQTGINLQTIVSSPSAEASSAYAQGLFATYFNGFTSKTTDLGCKFDKQLNTMICFSPTTGSTSNNTNYQTTYILKSTTITLDACQKTGSALTTPGCTQ